MNVLIVGGTGLISTALSRQLAERQSQVTVYNRGTRDVGLPRTVRAVTGDRYDHERFVRDMRSLGEFDCVVDMITYVPRDAQSLIDAFLGRTRHLIVCSTTDVYSKPAARYPYREDEPLGGASQYGRAKAACERMLMDAHFNAGLPVTILRPAHTYGPGGQHRGHVIHSMGKGTAFLDRLRRGKPVIVHGDGSSFWTSCHLEDVAAGFAGAVGNPVALGKSYHLPGDEWLTWNRYHELVAEAMGAPAPQIVHIPTSVLREVAPKRSQLAVENFFFSNIFDTAEARRDLGFRPKISFLDGMRDTIRWVENSYGFDSSDNDPLYDGLVDAWGHNITVLSQRLSGMDN